MPLTIVQAGMGGTGSTTASSTGTGAAVLATQPSFPSTIGVGGATASSSGAGITFPATQSASTDANTLDDYEEGTWTPSYSLGSGSGSFVTQIATYTKIGRVVTISLRFIVNNASNAANVAIGNLPFSFLNSNADSSAIFREYTTLGNFYGLSFGSSTAISMQRYDNNNGIPNGTPGFSGTLVYTAA